MVIKGESKWGQGERKKFNEEKGTIGILKGRQLEQNSRLELIIVQLETVEQHRTTERKRPSDVRKPE